MADRTAIEWADASWNPISGCTKVSPGCANCYIERTPAFRMAGRRFVKGEIPVLLHPERLEVPLSWRKPRRVFVCSMSDLFHEDVPDRIIWRVFWTMAQAQQHSFQVLTKRPERMQRMLSDAPFVGTFTGDRVDLPLPNVWLGVSVENQRWADERIPLLLETPAAVRFLSCEPLLGPLELRQWLMELVDSGGFTPWGQGINVLQPSRWIDWVIVGGESGPGSAERKLVERCPDWRHGGESFGPHRHGCKGWRPKPHALEWVRSIRDQCQAAGVPFFFKQWGGPRPKSGGRLLDGREWNEMPEREAVHA